MKVAVQGLLVLFLIISLNLVGNDIFTYAEDEETDRIVLKDADLIVEEYASGLKLPVMIDFIDESMLVIEKDGTVRIIKDEILASEPVLQLEVSTTSEEGLLRIMTFFCITPQVMSMMIQHQIGSQNILGMVKN